jgi:shikimate dehydrogenase
MSEFQRDVYALIGNPVGHSLSPVMHNSAYRDMDLNARYVSFCVKDLENAILGIRALDIKGVSVTIPHKVEVMKYLDEVDEEARKLGAVNTIINKNGRLLGSNTDWIGVVRTLQKAMDIKDKTFLVLGIGGTALAALFGIIREGGRPVIVNRPEEEETGREIARLYDCPFYPLSEIGQLKKDFLINTTPVGMYPNVDKSPVFPEILGNFRWVMDVIYNPYKTKLLRDAQAAGCGTLSGMDMFVHQGAEQIRLWTGREPNLALMREVVLSQLTNEK